MKKKRKVLWVLVAIFILSQGSIFTFAASHAYTSSNVNGSNISYVTLDMNDNTLKSVVLKAGNGITSTEPLDQMAKKVDAIAAINGTYFEAYEGMPVPWGAIIKDKKVVHIGNMGATAGITEDNKLIIDNLNIHFKGYINGQYRAIPWRINHPSTEADAITIFTPEYKQEVQLEEGGKAVIVTNGVVSWITDKNFTCPNNGFVIVYNSAVAYLVDERYKVGDKVEYEHEFETTHTRPEDWDHVVNAIGAGPSLIIHGRVTADGEAEGFWEPKINTNKASRSFIGSTQNDKIIIGNIPSATLKEAAAICQNLGLVNAMCLDGGWSTALYYKDKGSISQGRDVNNGLAFIIVQESTPEIGIKIDGVAVNYTEATGKPYLDKNGRMQVPLKVTMEAAGAKVTWDGDEEAATVEKDATTVIVKIGQDAIIVNGERVKNDTVAVTNNNKAYLPIKAVLEALGYKVTWENNTRTVNAISVE